MPATTVRSTDTMEAVHTSDADWEDVARGWMLAEGAPEERIDGFLAQFRAAVEEQGLARPWLLNTPRGIGMVAPHDFVKWYEDVAATDVLGDVFRELATHAEKGYDIQHDDGHTTSHFVLVMSRIINPLATPNNTLPDAVKRREFIKAASVAVAAVNKIDRANNVGTFAV